MDDTTALFGFWFAGAQVKVHLAADANADGLSLLEHRMAQGFSPPAHVHHDEDETFHILEGRIRFVADGVESVRGAGETVHIPRGVTHSFRVLWPEGARFLTMTRGGFERMIREASVPATVDAPPPPGEPTPAQRRILAEAGHRNGIDLVGPPLA